MAVISELIINNENVIEHESSTISSINVDGVDYNFAKNTESIGTCENAVKEPILNMQLDGNSIQNGTPSPETPIEIESVGERTKNLVNIPIIDSTTKTTTINCYLNKTFIVSCQEYPTLIANDSGVETSVWRLQFNFLDGTTQYILDDGLKKVGSYVDFIRATEENPVVSITYRSIYIREGEYEGIQIEYGETITDYEPYGYKVPIVQNSKNLFNLNAEVIDKYGTDLTIENNSIIATSTASGTYYNGKIKINDIKAGTKVTVSGQWVASSTNIGRLLFAYYDTFTSATTTIGIVPSSNEKITVTIPEKTSDTQILCMIVYSNLNGTTVAGDTVTYTNIQVEIGSTKTEYELYHEPITTNVYLNEPLRKIGGYSDYIDYKNKKVVRKIQELILNGTENWILGGAEGTKQNYYGYKLGSYGYVVANIGIGTHFVRDTISSSTIITGFNVLNSSGYAEARINVRPDDVVNITVDLWKTYLVEQNAKGTPVKFYYVLTNETEETIEIPEILMFKGTNVFDTDTTIQPSEIKINYWKQI